MTTKTPPITHKSSSPAKLPRGLLEDLRQMIDQTRRSIASTVNTGLTLLYWHVGSRIRKEILQDERAEYGQKIVATLWRQLAVEYNNSFNEKNLRRMMQFAEAFPDSEIVVSLIRQLSWTHFIALIPSKEILQEKLHRAIEHAHRRLEDNSEEKMR